MTTPPNTREQEAREVLRQAESDCACSIPRPWDEVAEHAICLAFANQQGEQGEVEGLRAALESLVDAKRDSGLWIDAVTPLIGRFEIAANFGADAVHNGTGADAIAKLIKAMAEKLDRAVSVARAALTNTSKGDEGRSSEVAGA